MQQEVVPLARPHMRPGWVVCARLCTCPLLCTAYPAATEPHEPPAAIRPLPQGAAGQRHPEDHHHPGRHAARAQPCAARQTPRLAAQKGALGTDDRVMLLARGCFHLHCYSEVAGAQPGVCSSGWPFPAHLLSSPAGAGEGRCLQADQDRRALWRRGGELGRPCSVSCLFRVWVVGGSVLVGWAAWTLSALPTSIADRAALQAIPQRGIPAGDGAQPGGRSGSGGRTLCQPACPACCANK